MLKRIFVLLFVFGLISCSYAKASENNNLIISNKYFSFTMPNETKGTYTVSKYDNGIFISEKISQKVEMGGGAFGLQIFKSPKEYADMINVKKIGELTDKNGKIYDMVLIRPTEIQYSDDTGVKERYERLYDFGDKVEIKGINGSKYVKDKGMKGEELYGSILKKYKTAIEEKWDSKKYEQEGMGYMYYTLANSNENLSDKIGYAYYDINSDGIDELFIGKITNSDSIIYDIYTMVNRKPTHVISGGDEDKYFVCNDYFLCNDYSEDSKQNTFQVLFLEKNSKELNPQVTFIYSKYENKKNPWFIGYGPQGELNNVSKKSYNKIKRYYKDYKKFDFTPLSELK